MKNNPAGKSRLYQNGSGSPRSYLLGMAITHGREHAHLDINEAWADFAASLPGMPPDEKVLLDDHYKRCFRLTQSQQGSPV